MNNSKSDFTQGSILGKLIPFMIPILGALVLQAAYGAVDLLVVGRFGSTSGLSAVSTGSQVLNLVTFVITQFATGITVLIARYIGEKKPEHIGALIGGSTIVFVIISAVLFVVMIGFARPISVIMQAPKEAVKLTSVYVRICGGGIFFIVAYNLLAAIFRGLGDSKSPLIFVAIACVINIIGDLVLVAGLHMDAAGAAIATVLARFVEMFVVVIWTHLSIKKYEFLRGVYRTLKISIGEVKVIIIKGLPIFLNEFFWSGGIAAMTQCYSIKGLQVIAGMNISNAICNLLNVVFIAMGNAVGIISGQYLGASKFEKAKKASNKLMWFTAGICVFLTAILIAGSGFFPKLYDTSDEVRHLGQWFIIITASFIPLQGFLNVLYFTLRSGGKTVITFLFDSIFTWVVSVSLAFVLCKFTALPILTIYIIVQSADIIKVVLGYILVKKGVWITNLVV